MSQKHVCIYFEGTWHFKIISLKYSEILWNPVLFSHPIIHFLKVLTVTDTWCFGRGGGLVLTYHYTCKEGRAGESQKDRDIEKKELQIKHFIIKMVKKKKASCINTQFVPYVLSFHFLQVLIKFDANQTKQGFFSRHCRAKV